MTLTEITKNKVKKVLRMGLKMKSFNLDIINLG